MVESKIIPFSEVTKFHGHVCPGSAIGYRAAEIAIKKLSSSRAEDEEFLAIVENDSCSVDAIQVVTCCTFGKGNLIFKDYGKNVYTFVNRKTGDSIRLSLNMSIDEIEPGFSSIRKRAFSVSASDEDREKLDKQKNALSEKILDMDDDEIFKIDSVKIEIPEEARIFKSVKCDKCGEYLAEHRARVENGEFVCIPCFDNYSRS